MLGGDAVTALQVQDPEPFRHQVSGLPAIQAFATEFQARIVDRAVARPRGAPHPDGVPERSVGAPPLAAVVGLLMGHFRQSKRRTAFFLQDFLGMPCCASLTVKMQNQVAAVLEQPYEELRQALAAQEQLNMDESPTKQGNQKAWLWAAVAAKFAVFAIFSSRKATALPKLLGNVFTGVINNCDRAKMYWRAKRLQWCWAHLKRDIQALIDHPDPQVRRLGHDLMRQVRLMFDTWWRYKLGKLTWEVFQSEMAPIRKKVDALLLRGVFSGNWRLTGMPRGTLRPPRLALDIRRSSGHRTHQQYGGTGALSGGYLPEAIVRNTERVGQPFHRTHVDRQRNLPTAITLDLRLPNIGPRSPFPTSALAFITSRGVNGYEPASGRQPLVAALPIGLLDCSHLRLPPDCKP